VWRRVDELAAPINAGNAEHRSRASIFVEIERDGSRGVGEVAPLPVAAYDDPAAQEVALAATGTMLSVLDGLVSREGALPSWSRVHLLGGDVRASIWSMAALEMALLDLELDESHESLETRWSIDADLVPVSATTSAIEPEPGWDPPTGAVRVRVKTTAGVNLAAMASSLSRWSRDVLLDFNGTAADEDDVLGQVGEASQFATVVAVEQPFAPGDLASHARLAERCPVRVGLDESVRSLGDVHRIARYGAASLLCVKPPRVGGLASARAILAACGALGLSSYVGGFFESPLARRAHRAVAAGSACEPSDVGPVPIATHRDDSTRLTGVGVVPDLRDAELLGARSW
jgi:O-succinylbenzoate synthase